MEPTENRSRERILLRVRRALKTAAPREAAPPGSEGKAIFPPIPDLQARFEAECAANITECFVTTDAAASKRVICELLTALPPGEIFAEDAPELREMSSCWQDRGIRWSSQGPPTEQCQATMTRCAALIALTGSVVVSSANGGRGASVVAPVHIVVAKTSQLVSDLNAAFAGIRQQDLAKNSSITLITGSSRTADIEKILVMGAHGPRRLVVVVSRT